MCDFKVDSQELQDRFHVSAAEIGSLFDKVMAHFPGMLTLESGVLGIPVAARPLTRMIARSFDAYDMSKAGHSSAI